MAKKKGVLTALFSGAGGKKSSSSRTSKSRGKPSSSKGKSAASRETSKTKTAPKCAASQAKLKNKRTSKSKAKKQYKKPLILIPVMVKDYRDKKGGHPHVILEDMDNKHVSVGLTQDKYKGRNATNYECQISPLGDNKHSYMRRQAQVEPKKDYYNPRNGKMDMGDYNRANIYGERAKEKYLQKGQKK